MSDDARSKRMAAQATRDRAIELLNRLQNEKGLSTGQALQIVLQMADWDRLRDWFGLAYEALTPEEREEMERAFELDNEDEV
jgi:hypothetical protein